jgi:hypothetical protein
MNNYGLKPGSGVSCNPGLKPGVSDDAMYVDFSPSTTSVLKAGVRIG